MNPPALLPPPPRLWTEPLLVVLWAVPLGALFVAAGAMIWMLQDSAPTPPAVVKARAEIEMLAAELARFAAREGRYPTEAEGLNALISPPVPLPPDAQALPRLKIIPLDPWGRTYQYKESPMEKGRYLLYSLGSTGAGRRETIGVQVPPAVPPSR